MPELSRKSDACTMLRADAPDGSRSCSLLRQSAEQFSYMKKGRTLIQDPAPIFVPFVY